MRHWVLLLLPAVAGGASAAATDPATGTPAQFFGPDKVYRIHLTLTAQEYATLEPSGGPSMARPGITGDDRYPLSTAILEFEGKRWGSVDLRYKGNSSYRSAGSLKRPIKLEFTESTFFGMTKINLNNNAMDPSQMREALGYDIFRHEGVPAPRTAFARVYLTVAGTYQKQYAGLYTVVEQIDQTFFKDRFGKKTSPVLKPERLNGMPYLGEKWSSYLVPYGAKSSDRIDPEEAKRFIDFTRFVEEAAEEEFAKRVAEFVDVDEFLRFLAVEVMMVNLDSPLGFNHNYYITFNPKTKKVIWIPWDLNLAFGAFGGGGRSGVQQDLSVNKPTGKGQFPLADRILAVPALLKQYDEIVRDLATGNFTVERLSAEMELMAGAIREAISTDRTVSAPQFERQMSANPSTVMTAEPASDPGGFDFGGPGRGPGMSGPPLRQFVALRVQSVLEQLDGKREGFTAPARGGGRGGAPRF